MTKENTYSFIDLFAGAGGLSEGFIRAGFHPIAYVEKDRSACNTLKTRSAYHYLENEGRLDIYEKYLRNKKEGTNGAELWRQIPEAVTQKVIEKEIGEKTQGDIFSKIDSLKGSREIDLIIGGPPCQAYSVAGRARMGKDVENDPRNELYKYYVEFIKKYRPKMFVFENVLGIKTAKNGGPFRDLEKLVNALGYDMRCEVQLASEHGVLQNRHRVIIVGWQRDGKKQYGYPCLQPEKLPFEVLKDLFSDLPVRKSGEGQLCGIVQYTKDAEEMRYLTEYGIRGTFDFTTQHVARPNNENDREIYKIAIEQWINDRKRLNYAELSPNLQKHKNKETFLNRFNVVDPYGYCHTVVAHIAMDGHYYIYPTLKPTVENVRSITVREAARLQSFPDDYFFEGSRTAAFRQIGNAVPVVLAQRIASAIKEML